MHEEYNQIEIVERMKFTDLRDCRNLALRLSTRELQHHILDSFMRLV